MPNRIDEQLLIKLINVFIENVQEEMDPKLDCIDNLDELQYNKGYYSHQSKNGALELMYTKFGAVSNNGKPSIPLFELNFIDYTWTPETDFDWDRDEIAKEIAKLKEGE